MKRICCELVCGFNYYFFFFCFFVNIRSEVSLKDFGGEFLLSYFIESLVLLTIRQCC